MFFLHKSTCVLTYKTGRDHLLNFFIGQNPNRQDTLYLWEASFWHDSFRQRGQRVTKRPRNWYVERMPQRHQNLANATREACKLWANSYPRRFFVACSNFCKQHMIKYVIEAAKISYITRSYRLFFGRFPWIPLASRTLVTMAFVYLLSTPAAILFRFSRGPRWPERTVIPLEWNFQLARSVVNVTRRLRSEHQTFSIRTTAARRVELDDWKLGTFTTWSWKKTFEQYYSLW